MSVFIPTYFSPISQYGMIYQADTILMETQDNYQKQTYRNRCYIYGANGKQLLNIPIVHNKQVDKQKSKDVKIESGTNWNKQHYKSLKSAYNSSPFFEFYEYELHTLLSQNYTYLLDLNLATLEFVNDALELNIVYTKTLEYQNSHVNDFRFLAQAKGKDSCLSNSYTQVFDDKFGFIENLSILDLIFMEGPNSISFLEKVNVTLP